MVIGMKTKPSLIRNRRHDLYLTLADVSKKTGLSISTIAKAETEGGYNLRTARLLNRALGLKLKA
jgi:transcriptional regulator with XRE-family HTH domain